MKVESNNALIVVAIFTLMIGNVCFSGCISVGTYDPADVKIAVSFSGNWSAHLIVVAPNYIDKYLTCSGDENFSYECSEISGTFIKKTLKNETMTVSLLINGKLKETKVAGEDSDRIYIYYSTKQ